ncbi:PD-(D/E)XK nuclease family protein [Sporosarcina sp. ACRSL]|uniref:PD-(D/E)XK nuclease family protein n=1 Tax=Sporosarcina sp. ACRSL TaxID=2918215 RepID=UPI001EF59268|nr:PD-(D/E)XK nuclease family protein [Sporosarcina sp. ACRSL]MCG7344022.1 PD-(D/E)XK nuclease family protein [Sporosarcina sp. ACRSL]
MKSLVCPRCSAELVEDAWEELQETNDGGIILGGYPAYVCREQCGYAKRIESIPPIIVQPEAPNLFQFATSELSQDAFLCYLIAWSSKRYRLLDEPLHEAAVHFISTIFNAHGITAPTVETVTIERQFKSLDIFAVINDTYAIVIEDKTFTDDHSDQLVRYREAVKREFPNLIQLPVYYKIADQSQYHSAIAAGYVPFKREMMIRILKDGIAKGVTNTIFLDYYRHLQKLEDKYCSFRTTPVSEWDSYAWQGFYQEIQKSIDGEWGYVPNRSGGFWAFWWKSVLGEKYYMQLEQTRLCVKVEAEEGEDKRELRKIALVEVLGESGKRDLHLKRPTRLGTGKTMTIAHRLDYIQTNVAGMADISRTVEELKKY